MGRSDDRWPPASTLRFRYRVVVHDGMWDADRCAGAWAAWAHTDGESPDERQ